MKKFVFVNKPVGLKYEKCRDYLRKTFDYSCAYCTITESESPGATFNIDHFLPVKYFPIYRDECINLRYSCPRCNSYKRDNWITKENGCIRNCEKCDTKVCTEDILRFINCLEEEPENMMSLDEDGRLFVINGSKPAEHTIKYLRLNRDQLIKLRAVRRLLNLWREELIKLKFEAQLRVESFDGKLKEFEDNSKSCNLEGKELLFQKIAIKQFEILRLSSQHHLDFIEDQLQKLEILINNRYGNDEYYV
jgi:uncharacterized protein (TIGR02646 family)